MGARGALFLGQRAQHDAGRLRCFRRGHGGWRALGAGHRLLRRLSQRWLGLRLGRSADGTAFNFLDHDLLAAAMAKALAHDTLLGAWLKRQLGDAQFLVARGLCFTHSLLCPRAPAIGACVQFQLGDVPVRKRSKRVARARKVSLTGPASSAACTTFGQFNAKSKCSPEKLSTTTISRGFSRILCCKAAASLRLPSFAASAAWMRANRSSRPTAASTLVKPVMTWPALPAIASASSAHCSSKVSMVAARSAATRTFCLKARANTLSLIASS